MFRETNELVCRFEPRQGESGGSDFSIYATTRKTNPSHHIAIVVVASSHVSSASHPDWTKQDFESTRSELYWYCGAPVKSCLSPVNKVILSANQQTKNPQQQSISCRRKIGPVGWQSPPSFPRNIRAPRPMQRRSNRPNRPTPSFRRKGRKRSRPKRLPTTMANSRSDCFPGPCEIGGTSWTPNPGSRMRS